MSLVVQCPTCAKQVEWNERQRWRPFCSERCRLIDLGLWASEELRIGGETVDTAEDAPPPPRRR